MIDSKHSSDSKVFETLRRKVLADVATADECAKLGDLMIQRGNWKEVIPLYEKAIELAPTNFQKGTFSVELGWNLYGWGRSKPAHLLANNALELLRDESARPQHFFYRGSCQSLLAHCAWSKEDSAAKKFAHLALESLEKVTAEDSGLEIKAAAYFETARLRLLLGDTARANELCEKGLQYQCNDWEQISGLAIYIEGLRRAGETEKAEHNLLRAIRVADSYKCLLPGLYLNLGIIQREANRLPEAQQSFQNAVDALEGNVDELRYNDLYLEIAMHLAEAHYVVGAFKEAMLVYEKVVLATPLEDPYHSTAQLWLGRCHEAREEYTDACACFQKVIGLARAKSDQKQYAQEGLARALYSLGDYQAAVANFIHLLSVYDMNDPGYFNACLWLGHCYEKLGDRPKAQQMYKTVLKAPHADGSDKNAAWNALERLPSLL